MERVRLVMDTVLKTVGSKGSGVRFPLSALTAVAFVKVDNKINNWRVGRVVMRQPAKLYIVYSVRWFESSTLRKMFERGFGKICWINRIEIQQIFFIHPNHRSDKQNGRITPMAEQRFEAPWLQVLPKAFGIVSSTHTSMM